MDSLPHPRGDWMQTFTGLQFWPLSPDPRSIVIEDIAHALANQCRFAGHCIKFYSVAEHSVHVSRSIVGNPRDALWGLLHDAAEAYLVDVPRPLKPYLANYSDIEASIMSAVCRRFGLGTVMPAAVKQADNRILNDERDQNLFPPPRAWAGDKTPLGVQLQLWSPDRAEREFLDDFHALTSELKSS